MRYSWYSTDQCVDNRFNTIRMNERYRFKPIANMRKKKNNMSLIREAKGWRQLDLARKLDGYQSEVSAIERAEREPGVYLAKRIARALGKKVDEVF